MYFEKLTRKQVQKMLWELGDMPYAALTIEAWWDNDRLKTQYLTHSQYNTPMARAITWQADGGAICWYNDEISEQLQELWWAYAYIVDQAVKDYNETHKIKLFIVEMYKFREQELIEELEALHCEIGEIRYPKSSVPYVWVRVWTDMSDLELEGRLYERFLDDAWIYVSEEGRHFP